MDRAEAYISTSGNVVQPPILLMKAYRFSVNLKLGLILFAVVIAVSSLWYTNDLVQRLRERETSIVQLWAQALEQVPKVAQEGAFNPYQDVFRDMDHMFAAAARATSRPDGITPEEYEMYIRAIAWAQSMPPASDLTFILDAFLEPNAFGIPAILVDSLGRPTIWRNVPVEVETMAALDSLTEVDPSAGARVMSRLGEILEDMDAVHTPVPIVVSFPASPGRPAQRLVQAMHYGESSLVLALRWFPYVQLGFVSLFVLVGYFGFSYVRRSEQSSLWIGMAKEAAHQLGTPISSLMGWLEFLRTRPNQPEEQSDALDEVERDIQRLVRVASRFSDIGSLPKLDIQPLEPVIENITGYMRHRLPKSGKMLKLSVSVPGDIRVPINAELFEWVIENLIKNAMDSIEAERGKISVVAEVADEGVTIDVRDTGKGIERRQWKHVFRPGYSTKKRGWGLGLSLAKRIVEDYHGGTLSVYQSKLGHGTTFRIVLPSV